MRYTGPSYECLRIENDRLHTDKLKLQNQLLASESALTQERLVQQGFVELIKAIRRGYIANQTGDYTDANDKDCEMFGKYMTVALMDHYDRKMDALAKEFKKITDEARQAAQNINPAKKVVLGGCQNLPGSSEDFGPGTIANLPADYQGYTMKAGADL